MAVRAEGCVKGRGLLRVSFCHGGFSRGGRGKEMAHTNFK
ncbi:hypothetical protein E2C01_089190 [Portunus trituberculatus]|uniref:Uncharacterized protein n=1 Tax=Portunus trituberculatus TaxID=210409 RepID=A0A5B7JGK7_PORTR|nr:hypothetical protein [Portunus trituberculatus]